MTHATDSLFEMSERVSSGHDTPHATSAVLTHTRAMFRPHTRARRIVAAGAAADVAVPMLPLLFFCMAVHYKRRAYVNKHVWEW